MMTVYTTLKNVSLPGVSVVTVAAATKAIKKSSLLYFDAETMAKDFDRDLLIDQYMIEQESAGKKITKTTKKSAVKYAEDLRNEMALDPYRSVPALLQVQTDSEEIYVIDWRALTKVQANKLIDAVSHKLLIGQNLKFDLKLFMANYPAFQPGEIWDTMIAYKLIRTAEIVGFYRSTLDRVVKYHTGVELAKEHGADNWGETISPEMLQYAIDDVKYMNLVYQDQLRRLNQESIYTVSNSYAGTVDAVAIIEMKFVKVLAAIELAGFPVDIKTLEERRQKLAKEIEEYQKPFIKNDVNPRSPAQLMAFLADEYPDEDIMSTSKGTLAKYADLPLVEQLMELKKRLKEEQMIDDYINKWPVNGRIHSSYNQMRAPTGRMSSSNPNAQQIPRAIKDLIYLGTKKRPIIKADYPNIEARTMAVVANDMVLIDLFKQGLDMHIVTAAAVARKHPSKVTKDERNKAKPVNFGFMYGMGAKTFIEYAFVNYGIKYSMTESQDARDTFLHKYSGIQRLHNRHSQLLAENREITLRTLLGRRMRVERFTDANNYPVQGSAADMIKLAAGMIYEKAQKQKIDIRIINIVHDELVCDCSARDLNKAKKLVQQSMETSAEFVLQLFKTPVEVEVVCH